MPCGPEPAYIYRREGSNMKLNQGYRHLQNSYFFSSIVKKTEDYRAQDPKADIIRLGVGDVSIPLCPAVVHAMQQAVQEMGRKGTFHGYGPEQGYDFLRSAIRGYYRRYGVRLEMDEIFVSDGANSDLGNILDLFDSDNTVLIPNPVYPVYEDTNIMAGRKILYMHASEQNGFLPLPDKSIQADIIYLCSPGNPTGAVYSRAQLEKWVDYANDMGAIIIFDAAYESFIATPDLPHSIFEIRGAKTCAIEICSLSKTAGFTGTRCGYTVVPRRLVREGLELRRMWLRRQTTKFNGVSYIVQRGAEAVFSPEGIEQTRSAIAYYRENGRIIKSALEELGIWHVGGEHSPYVWLKCPSGMGSWAYFEYLLHTCHIVSTPGAGFGSSGEGYLRLSSFAGRDDTVRAMERFIQKGIPGQSAGQ